MNISASYNNTEVAGAVSLALALKSVSFTVSRRKLALFKMVFLTFKCIRPNPIVPQYYLTFFNLLNHFSFVAWKDLLTDVDLSVDANSYNTSTSLHIKVLFSGDCRVSLTQTDSTLKCGLSCSPEYLAMETHKPCVLKT